MNGPDTPPINHPPHPLSPQPITTTLNPHFRNILINWQPQDEHDWHWTLGHIPHIAGNGHGPVPPLPQNQHWL